ncbi:MAG: hypothetical protein OEZ33_08740 [Gammaproteobacteria bacterium]|nr:hypothetical protein [Gammaproteobacteria bacterium]
MKKLLAFIQHVSTGKVVLALFIPATMIYLIMILVTIPTIMEYVPKKLLFDLSPTGYSFEYAQELLAALGNEGRELYLYRQLPLDFIYPGLFALSSCTLLAWLFLKVKDTNSSLFYVCFVPVVASLFDYLENIGVVSLLISYPNISAERVSFASAMTIIKSGLTTVYFVFLIYAGGLIFRKKWRI